MAIVNMATSSPIIKGLNIPKEISKTKSAIKIIIRNILNINNVLGFSPILYYLGATGWASCIGLGSYWLL